MRATVRAVALTAGLLLPLLVFQFGASVAGTAPDVSIWKTVDRAVAGPGALLTYTIYIDNRGPESALVLWVNDTLPTGATYRGSTVLSDIGSPPFINESIAGPTVRWQFWVFPAGNLSFRMFAQIGSGYPDGDRLQNLATLWYTNATGVPQPIRTATATTTISIPVISVTKTGTFTSVDAITYTITVTNVGSGAAVDLWLNDTLPPGVQFVQIRAQSGQLGLQQPCTVAGQRVDCVGRNPFLPFGPGSKTWLLDARIPSPPAPGTVITNRVSVNYTDADGTYLREAKANASLTIQAADIQAYKIASSTVAPPGGTITYTIFYTNHGQVTARDVWINDTLPVSGSLPAVTVISASPAPTLNTTAVVRWLLNNVAIGNHSVTLTVRTLPGLGAGTRLVNSVTLNYTNADGRERPGSASSATTTISLNVPSIDADLVARPVQVPPGGDVAYTLFYNNSRPALARTVRAEVFLPAGVPLSSADPVYTSTGPGKYIWELSDVGSGEHHINITVSVPGSFTAGPPLRATAFVNYTDDAGAWIGGSQTFADVTVSITEPPESSPWYLIVGAGVAIAGVLAGVVVWRIRSGANDTVIDEVFLLHRDGLLIKHYTRRLKPDVDSDILSGMLIAVQNFVNESFIGEAGLRKEGQLDEMKFGQYRILLSRGKFVIVGAVISGPQVEKVPAQIRAAIHDLEDSLGAVLEGWDGDMDEVTGADAFMQDLISGKYRARIARPRGNR